MIAQISARRLAQLRQLIADGKEAAFYSWTEWLQLRRDVLALDRFECQHCKERGKYSRAQIVHHVKHLRDRPDLALSAFDPDTGERQLVSLCKSCHELEHPEAMRQTAPKKPVLTMERWD